MKIKACVLVIALSMNGAVWGEKLLERAEIEQIFKLLTDQPRKAWITSGTIYANHEEYRAPQTTIEKEIDQRINQEVKAYLDNPRKTELTEKQQQMKLGAIPFNVRYQLSNEIKMNSKVTLKYDGNRFYWEIIVDSREDSVKPAESLLGNYYTEEFNLGWNMHRIFAWDSSKYTNYFRPGNQATIEDKPGNVNGPLTAGIITWGYGRYSYQNLLKAKSSAMEVESNNQTEIHLSIAYGDQNEIFILDPSKEFCVTFHSVTTQNGLMKVCTYSNYEFTGKSWCPHSIKIELYDSTLDPHKLLSYDTWDFTSLSSESPEGDDFSVKFEYDALINDYRFGKNPFRFRYSPPENPTSKNTDINGLMQERLEMSHLSGLQAQNCATASLKYICKQLGYDVSWKELSQLISEEEKNTNMLEMQRFLKDSGLYTLAAKTDLENLKQLNDYQILLYLPNDNHYVVFANTDKKYVRLMDPDQNNLYYRQTKESFNRNWDGTVFIVDKKPIQINSGLTKIPDKLLSEIVGAASCQLCNTKVQDPNTLKCGEPCSGACGGAYKIVYEIWQCGDSSSGSCSNDDAIKYKSAPCVIDPNYSCSGNGDWTSYPIYSCPHS